MFCALCLVKKVELLFPDTGSIADFVVENSIAGALVTSAELKLSAFLTDEQIDIAVSRYGSLPKEQITESEMSYDKPVLVRPIF